jgi:hypothetical protein
MVGADVGTEVGMVVGMVLEVGVGSKLAAGFPQAARSRVMMSREGKILSMGASRNRDTGSIYDFHLGWDNFQRDRTRFQTSAMKLDRHMILG